MSDIIADVSMEEYLDQADLSDEEDAQPLQLTPFHVDWLDLTAVGCPNPLGISGLPGCRYQEVWRNLAYDLDCLKQMGIEEIFSLCSNRDLYLCRVKNLKEKCLEEGFIAHQYDVEDGQVLEMNEMMNLIEEIRTALLAGRKTLVHCHGDGGRSSVVAICLLMVLDKKLNLDDAIEKVQALKENPAVPSIKQYNFVNGFKDALEDYTR